VEEERRKAHNIVKHEGGNSLASHPGTSPNAWKLFWQLKREWSGISTKHINTVFEACELYFENMVSLGCSNRTKAQVKRGYFTDPGSVGKNLWLKKIRPELEARRRNALDEFSNLEDDARDVPQTLDLKLNKKMRVRQCERDRVDFMETRRNLTTSERDAEVSADKVAKAKGQTTQYDDAVRLADKVVDAAWALYEVNKVLAMLASFPLAGNQTCTNAMLRRSNGTSSFPMWSVRLSSATL
jgi:hypothetical protein